MLFEKGTPDDADVVGYTLGPSGGFLRRLARRLFFWVPRPVVALGRYDLYLFRIRGSDFRFRIKGVPPSWVTGFATTRVVSASSLREAEPKAISSVVEEWRSNKWPGGPHLEVLEVEVLSRRLWLYRPAGFTLYDTSDET